MSRNFDQFNVVTFNNIEHYSQLPVDIVTGIGIAVNSAFGGTVTVEDARDHMTGNQVLVTLDKASEEVAGFTSTVVTSPRQRFGEEILSDAVGTYFAGAAIAQKYQGKGLYHLMNDKRLEFALASEGTNIFTQTQNPRVIEGLTDDLERMVDLGRIGKYTVSTVIRQGAYGQMLTAEKPVARDLELDLDYNRGDAAVVTWHLDK